MHRKGTVQKRPAERVRSRPHENARHKRRRACAHRLARVPCHWSHGPGTRTNCNATRRHRSRASARRARGTFRKNVRTARMGSGRRCPSGAGPCGQSASEPSRSSTASCPRRDPGPCPSSLPHCTRTTHSATPRRRKSVHACRARGTSQKNVRTARMGSGRRYPLGAGPCGQSASEPSRSSTASCPRRDPGPCPSSLPHCTRTTHSATPRRRKSVHACRARGTSQKNVRTARMGSGRRYPLGAGPCGQSASEPSRSSTASCPRRDPGPCPSSLPHCTYTTHSATPRRRKSAGGHRGPGCCQKSCRNYHIGRSEGIRWQSIVISSPLLEPPRPGMLSNGLGAPFAHVQPVLVLRGRPCVPRAETRGAGRAQSTRTIRT